jgi:hypothetical protein
VLKTFIDETIGVIIICGITLIVLYFGYSIINYIVLGSLIIFVTVLIGGALLVYTNVRIDSSPIYTITTDSEQEPSSIVLFSRLQRIP